MNTTYLRLIQKCVITSMILILLGAACQPVTEVPEVTQAPPNAEPTATLPVTNCETLLPADACDPEWQARIEYVPLAGLPTITCTETLITGGQCDARVYTNNGQQFVIRIEGADPAVISDYINNTEMYFEVREAGVEPPVIPELPSLGGILINAATQLTNSSLDDFIAKLQELLKEREGTEQTVTFADVLIAITGDTTIPDQVLELAISNATSAYEAAGEDTSLLTEELKALMYEPGASVLVDPASLPADNSGYQDMLMNNPGSLAVIFDWTTVPKEEQQKMWTIWYAVDPPIGASSSVGASSQTPVARYTLVYYKAKCGVYSAYTRIIASAGSMTDYFWRQSPYLGLPSRTANVNGNAAPPPVTHSSYPNRVTYDTQVFGGPSGGQYTLYGGWVQGSGCQ